MHVLVGPNGWGLEDVIPELRTRYSDVTFSHCEDHACVADAIVEADAYFGWLDRQTFQTAKNLKWIQSPSTGVDMFMRIPELRESDVILTNARGVHAVCLAEHTFAMIFTFTRGIKAFLEHQERHAWAGRELRNNLVELTGSTLGIVGFGTVGHAIADRAKAFGMRVQAVDLLPEPKLDRGVPVEGEGGLDALLKTSDYVVITVPYTEQTQGMIGAEQIALMKPTAMLVVISRGGIVDERALTEALQEGRLAAAALDVFEKEPLPAESPLWDIDNLLITPHAAGGSQFEAQAIRAIFTENLARFLRHDLPLRNQVGKKRGF